MAALETKIPPPLVALLFALLMAVAAGVLGELSLQFSGQRWLAAGLVIAAVAVIAPALLSFRKAQTTVNPTRPADASTLVTGGIFGRTRNPMYLGLALILTGWAVFLGSLPALLLVYGFAAYLSRFQIQPEERALKAQFGPAFEAYCAKVRRWL